MSLWQASSEACKQPTLMDALSWICVWENDRSVRQALRNNCRLESGTLVVGKDSDATMGQGWDTCFGICLKTVMEEWERKTAAIKAEREKRAIARWRALCERLISLQGRMTHLQFEALLNRLGIRIA